MMDLNQQKAQALLQKYMEGKCTPEEIILLHSWYDQLPESGVSEDPLLAQRLHDATWEKIRRLEPRPVRRIDLRLLAVAACAIGILLCGSALFLFQRDKAHRFQHIENSTAGISHVVLPDGTQVWLNAHSRLNWRNGGRTVQLEGEGYFDVAKDAAHPFQVQTGDFTTKVLGTTFNMECYPGEQKIRVALVKGSVQLSLDNGKIAPMLLKPGQVASFSAGDAAFQVSGSDAAAYSAWTSGGFVLQDVPLEKALRRLCRRYGYKLRDDVLYERQKSISATFTNSNSFEEILNGILYVNHLTYSIRDSVVTLQ